MTPPAKTLTRRRFLRLALAASATLWLDACRRQAAPTPTPTRTPSPPPTATPTGTPGANLVHQPLVLNREGRPTAPTPSATASDTPQVRGTSQATATPTEAPTATPTPSATPFPPGPPTKLGLFVGRNDPQLFDLLRTGNVAMVKTLEYDPNFVAEIKRISPQTLVVARYTPLPLPNLNDWDPLAAARQFVDLLLPIASEPQRQAHIDAWESYNEPAPAGESQMAALALFEAERTRLLAAAGIRSCVGNFSTGQPPLELWPAFFPALEAVRDHGGYLGLHEYSAPTMWFGSGAYQLHPEANEGDEGWLTLRYRKVYRQYLQPAGLAVPLLITELGVDGQVGNRPGPAGLGWRDFQPYWRDEALASTTTEGFYVEQLAWYDGEIGLDDYVKGAAIYALAGPGGWASFEIGGAPLPILRQYLSVRPPR